MKEIHRHKKNFDNLNLSTISMYIWIIIAAIFCLFASGSGILHADQYNYNNPYQDCDFDPYDRTDSSNIKEKIVITAIPRECAKQCESDCNDKFMVDQNATNNGLAYKCIQQCQAGKGFSAYRLESNSIVSQSGKEKIYRYSNKQIINPPNNKCNLTNIDVKRPPIFFLTETLYYDPNEYKDPDAKTDYYIAFTLDRIAENNISLCGQASETLVPLRDNVYKLIPESMKNKGDASIYDSNKSRFIEFQGSKANLRSTTISNALDKNQWGEKGGEDNQWDSDAHYRSHPCFVGLDKAPTTENIAICTECFNKSNSEDEDNRCIHSKCNGVFAEQSTIASLNAQGCFPQWSMGSKRVAYIPNIMVADGDQLNINFVGDIALIDKNIDLKSAYFSWHCGASHQNAAKLSTIESYIGSNQLLPLIGLYSAPSNDGGLKNLSLCDDPSHPSGIEAPIAVGDSNGFGLKPNSISSANGIYSTGDNRVLLDIVIPTYMYSGNIITGLRDERKPIGFYVETGANSIWNDGKSNMYGGFVMDIAWKGGVIKKADTIEYMIVPKSDFHSIDSRDLSKLSETLSEKYSDKRWHKLSEYDDKSSVIYDHRLSLNNPDVRGSIVDNGIDPDNQYVILLRISPDNYKSLGPTCDLTKSIGKYTLNVNIKVDSNSGTIKTIRSWMATLIKITQEIIFGDIGRGEDNESPFKTMYLSVVGDLHRYLMIIVSAYIMAQSLLFLFGYVQSPVKNITDGLFKMAIIAYLISPAGWSMIGGTIIPFFIEGMLTLSYKLAMTYNNDYSVIVQGRQLDDIFKPLSDILSFLSSGFFWKRLWALLFSGISGFISCFIILFWIAIPAIFNCIKLLVIFCFAIAGISFMMIVAPIFMIFMLFGTTKNLFNQWFKNLLFYMISPSFIVLFTSIIGALISVALLAIMNFPICHSCILNVDIPFVGRTCLIPFVAPLVVMHAGNNIYTNFIPPFLGNFSTLIVVGFLGSFFSKYINYCIGVIFRIIAFRGAAFSSVNYAQSALDATGRSGEMIAKIPIVGRPIAALGEISPTILGTAAGRAVGSFVKKTANIGSGSASRPNIGRRRGPPPGPPVP